MLEILLLCLRVLSSLILSFVRHSVNIIFYRKKKSFSDPRFYSIFIIGPWVLHYQWVFKLNILMHRFFSLEKKITFLISPSTLLPVKSSPQQNTWSALNVMQMHVYYPHWPPLMSRHTLINCVTHKTTLLLVTYLILAPSFTRCTQFFSWQGLRLK